MILDLGDKHGKGLRLLQEGFTQPCKNRSLLESLASLWGDFTSFLCWSPTTWLFYQFLFLDLLPHFPGAYPLLAFQEILSRGGFLFVCFFHVWECLYKIDSLGMYRVEMRNNFPLGFEDIVLLYQSTHRCKFEEPEAIWIFYPCFPNFSRHQN